MTAEQFVPRTEPASPEQTPTAPSYQSTTGSKDANLFGQSAPPTEAPAQATPVVPEEPQGPVIEEANLSPTLLVQDDTHVGLIVTVPRTGKRYLVKLPVEAEVDNSSNG